MNCIGKFKFKGIVKKDGGSFVNQQGKEITYPEKYEIRVDEVTDNGIFERSFKLATNSDLVQELLITKPYTDIKLEFDINIYGKNVALIPVAIVK